MVNPIHLQDNLSKTLLAQEVMDRMLEGAQKARDQSATLAQRQIEDEARNKTEEMEEKPGTSSIRSEDKKKSGEKRKRKRGKKGKDKESIFESVLNDLPRRKSEDDVGKGKKIDVKL